MNKNGLGSQRRERVSLLGELEEASRKRWHLNSKVSEE